MIDLIIWTALGIVPLHYYSKKIDGEPTWKMIVMSALLGPFMGVELVLKIINEK